MSRRNAPPGRGQPQPRVEPGPAPAAQPIAPAPAGSRFWTPLRTRTAVVLLLFCHLALAESSLLTENPTVDEAAHLPAGVTYWQKRTFRLYHHNPPLVKLIAALPVVLSKPETRELYDRSSWLSEPPDQASFAHAFAFYNSGRFFELFQRARMVMPLFGIVGGLAVFLWSRDLFGAPAGLLSLALWSLCPNILAHDRLVTTDAGAAALGVAATYGFWRYLRKPSLKAASIAGVLLGLALLTKFSMMLLVFLWPAMALWRRVVAGRSPAAGPPRRLLAGADAALIGALAIFTVNLGYGFENTGIALGKYELASRSLTRPVDPGERRPRSRNPLLDGAWKYRINRFRGTVLAGLPVPLPEHFVLGLDEQKLEAEGVPRAFLPGAEPAKSRAEAEADVVAYPAYLDGKLERGSWIYYYLYALMYKTPEGTWLLAAASVVCFAAGKRSLDRAAVADRAIPLIIPAAMFAAMSAGTNINIGLRYILPIFPFAFVFMGSVAEAAQSVRRGLRVFAVCALAAGLAGNVAAVATIHPHHLAYFNWVSGGPARGAEHLIDSNLDWGQDLIGLARRLRAIAPGEPVGLAYFGQIQPNLLKAADLGFDWFVPPARSGALAPSPSRMPRAPLRKTLEPGLYAISASLVHGLPWNLYDPTPLAIYPGWRADENAYSYFQKLKPIDSIGYSILIYSVTREDASRLSAELAQPRPSDRRRAP